jgi:hypothetical protein
MTCRCNVCNGSGFIRLAHRCSKRKRIFWQWVPCQYCGHPAICEKEDHKGPRVHNQRWLEWWSLTGSAQHLAVAMTATGVRAGQAAESLNRLFTRLESRS